MAEQETGQQPGAILTGPDRGADRGCSVSRPPLDVVAVGPAIKMLLSIVQRGCQPEKGETGPGCSDPADAHLKDGPLRVTPGVTSARDSASRVGSSPVADNPYGC